MSNKKIVPSEEELLSIPSAFIRCQICNLRVRTKSNLRVHLIKTHKLLQDENDVAFLNKTKIKSIYTYHCPVLSCKHGLETCHGFSSFYRLKQHYQIVHMKKSLKCTYCDQLFSTPRAQAYHSKTCGILYECPVCCRSYRQKKFLNQHARRSGHSLSSNVFPQIKIEPYRSKSKIPPKNVSEPTLTPIKPVIFPILVLPLGVSTENISSAAISSALADAFSQFKGSIGTVSLADTLLSANNLINGCPNSDPPLYTQSVQTSLPSTNAVFQQTSPNINHDYSLASLVDVGTTTLRLTNAQTQTRCHNNAQKKSMPISMKTGTEDDDLSDLFLDVVECCTETSPTPTFISPEKASAFAPSQTGIYMTSVETIDLNNPEINSGNKIIYPEFSRCNNFIRSSRQLDVSSNFLSSHFRSSSLQPTSSQFHEISPVSSSTMFPVNAHSCGGISSTSHLCKSDVNSQIFQNNSTLLNVSSDSHSEFTLCQQFSWSDMQIQENPTQQSTDCCMSTQCEYLSEDYIDSDQRNLLNQDSFSCQDQQDEFNYNNASTWMHLLPADNKSNSQQLHVACTAKPSSQQSVAVETTIDLMGFDLQNAGNCCWPLTDSFSNMHTQTTGDAELDQWLNSVHTQTVLQECSQNFIWPNVDAYSPLDSTVCVGVNTDLRTPDTRNRYI